MAIDVVTLALAKRGLKNGIDEVKEDANDNVIFVKSKPRLSDDTTKLNTQYFYKTPKKEGENPYITCIYSVNLGMLIKINETIIFPYGNGFLTCELPTRPPFVDPTNKEYFISFDEVTGIGEFCIRDTEIDAITDSIPLDSKVSFIDQRPKDYLEISLDKYETSGDWAMTCWSGSSKDSCIEISMKNIDESKFCPFQDFKELVQDYQQAIFSLQDKDEKTDEALRKLEEKVTELENRTQVFGGRTIPQPTLGKEGDYYVLYGEEDE